MKGKQKRRKKGGLSQRFYALVMTVCVIVGVCIAFAYAATGSSDVRKLQNGSFELGIDSGSWGNNVYSQPNHDLVSDWSTTAFEKKIELFKENTGTYIKGVTLAPPDGKIAAELNADEESTLYQTVSTSPSSIYEWGLDHGARSTKDTMALVIGPKQSVDPSKPSKAGRDQLMQMIDWLTEEEKNVDSGQYKQYIIYSKPFGEKGTFQNNEDKQAFSKDPSTVYTEEWHIWVMASSCAASGKNPWNPYGSNADTGSSEQKSRSVDTSKYYLYTVPAGQPKTLFAFVSVESKSGNKTFGNFLDNINFQLYHPLSGSSTAHGSAVVGSSDGSSSGEGADSGHKVTVDSGMATYVTDGNALRIQAIVKKDDKVSCEFVGVNCTTQDAAGNPQTSLMSINQKVADHTLTKTALTEKEKQSGRWVEMCGEDGTIQYYVSLTDEEIAAEKWLKTTNADGDIVYTTWLAELTTATDLHFIFIKSPTVTYDPNGGHPYVVEREYNTRELPNVYSFKPVNGSDMTFIRPYVSHAAEGDDGWKFMGWLLTGDKVPVPNDVTQTEPDRLNNYVLPAQHTVACNYYVPSASKEAAVQYFKVYAGSVDTKADIAEANGQVLGASWKPINESITPEYANAHKGLTMVAQWRWRQAFITQIKSGGSYISSPKGGTVEISNVTALTDAKKADLYESSYDGGNGQAYYATMDEVVEVTATAKDGYTFEGWYDKDGNLLTTKATYKYTETKGSVKTFYARFSGSVIQTYIRQIEDESGHWINTNDDKYGTLSPYSYTDAKGTKASSTAVLNDSYGLVGWYDAAGNQVDDSWLSNGNRTISYTTTEDATYYARFRTAYSTYFKPQYQKPDGTIVNNDSTAGTVSVGYASEIAGRTVSSTATEKANAKFLGWYDESGTLLSGGATYKPTVTEATNNKTYYARFEILYDTKTTGLFLSFVPESEATGLPDVFSGRHAGAGRYGLEDHLGNTISTGFKYKIYNLDGAKTIEVTVSIPADSYVKVGGTGKFTGNGTAILTDSENVQYNKGSIQKINSKTTVTYHWDTTGMAAGEYGFIIDNLYAPNATMTIKLKGTGGTKVTSTNGVVNVNGGSYRGQSHYPKYDG